MKFCTLNLGKGAYTYIYWLWALKFDEFDLDWESIYLAEDGLATKFFGSGFFAKV